MPVSRAAPARGRRANPSKPPFPGFGEETMRFLGELAQNNERAWFEANKHRYEAHLLEPALSFVETMAPRIARISTHLVAIPKRTGGSLMRVYRDTRFSRNKAPYKTNIGIQFRHERGKDVHAPGFYVHIQPGGCFLGAGIWHPEASALSAIRTAIVDNPRLWKRTRDNRRFREYFKLGGEQLKRPPRGFAEDVPHAEDLRRKDFIAICEIDELDAMRPEFAAQTAMHFKSAAPLMAFLCAALDLRF